MKLKRCLSFLLVMLLCVALIGCGEKVEEYEKEGFVLITDVIPDAILEVRYYSTFNFVGELSHPDYTETLTQEQIDNRMILRDAMVSNGFCPLPEEWWHFTLENEPYPDTYFDFPVKMPED